MAGERLSFSQSELRAAVAASYSASEVLRRLGLRAAGGNHRTLRKYAEQWGVSTDHFDGSAWQRTARRRGLPLGEIMVEHSTYSNRGALKERLYFEGLKQRLCELCGQGELWHDRPMSLILDHVNGTHDDNRLENLRIVCPNCNATLDTHCGRQQRKVFEDRSCLRCEESFAPKTAPQRYCSQTCGRRWSRTGRPIVALRRVDRPPHGQLVDEIARSSYAAVGRAYGVSDNAVRKWVRQYESGRPTM